MKLTTPFTILNRKFNKMDLIRDAMKKRKMFKNKEHPNIVNGYIYPSTIELN